MKDFFGDDLLNKSIRFIAEPGRYFVEKSHTLVLNVIGKKRETYINNDTNELEEIIIYYLNDGVYGSFNCIYFDHKKPCVLPFNERNEKILYKSKIFGPTCDSIDLITEEIMLPELAIGEWVYVENFGAYTTASSSSFNGFITTDYKYILRNYTNWKEK
jgi:ornithine decarboxylase